jgi:hypothetical protein
MSTPTGPLADAARRINDELRRKPQRIMRFDPAADVELEIVHAQYVGDVGEEAVRIARRQGLVNVDASHIEQAATWINAGGNRRQGSASTVLNTFGGLIGGAGAASIYALAYNPDPHTTAEHLTGLILCVLGAILLTAGSMLELTRRKRS